MASDFDGDEENRPRRADGDVSVPRGDGACGSAPGRPEWYSRGYLPHRDCLNLLQFITFRLGDSLPQSLLVELEEELLLVPNSRREAERRKRIEEWLDKGMGCCALRHSEAATSVQATLLHFDGQHYRVIAWVIMPNHVHSLIETLEPIAKTVQAWKSFSARWLLANNQRLGLGIPDPHTVWMREYWDCYIRDERHLEATIEYIHHNPVKAGLCGSATDWPWSSARRFPGNVPEPGNADVPVGPGNEDATGSARPSHEPSESEDQG